MSTSVKALLTAPRKPDWPVLALVWLGAALRLVNLGGQSLWLDELFSHFLAEGSLTSIISGTAADILPPFYYFLQHLMQSVVNDELGLRYVPWSSGTMTLPLLYIVARRLFGRPSALAALTLLAVNPLHIIFAQEARMYTLLTFLTGLSWWFFLSAWRTGQRRQWALFALTTIAAFYTHSLAFLNLAALDLVALTQRKQLRHRWSGLLAAHLAVGVAFLPWLLVIAAQAGRLGSEFAGGGFSPLTLLTALIMFLFGVNLPGAFVPLALFASLTLLAFAAYTRVRVPAAARAGKRGLRFATIALMVPLLGLLLLSLIQPIFVVRRVLPASLGLLLLLGWAVARAKPRPLVLTMSAALIAATLAALPPFYLNPAAQKVPFEQVASAVAATVQDGDGVVHATDTSALAFNYYASELPNYFLAGDPDYEAQTNRGRAQRIAGLRPMPLDQIRARHDRLWLIVTLDHNVDYQQARVEEFDRRFDLIDQRRIGGVDILLYQINEPR
ncbi:MAG: glycosyltransferase family 39 protein [Candidatus Promineifilaceae bacterium]|nr:glycosyltransferase family 39 protein [Candidatus Promineifilaceae bacterium]